MATPFSHAAVVYICLLSCLLLGIGALPSQNTPMTSPPMAKIHAISEQITTATGSTAALLRKQLTSPAEVLTVLLLIGGDIIQKACAQLSCGNKGPRLPTPVAFSFGWVAYAFGALISAFGDGSLMPTPDITSFVVTVNGQFKTNESWVISRLIRDLELEHERGTGGLRVVFYQTNGNSNTPQHDYVWKTWIFFIPLQFGVASIPIRHRNLWLERGAGQVI